MRVEDEVAVAQDLQAVGAAQGLVDQRSASALALSWIDRSDEHRTQNLRATITNNQANPSRVRLSLLVTGINNEVLERPQGEKSVPPTSSIEVSFPVSALPLQSAGMATVVTLVGEYAQRNEDDVTWQKTFAPFVHVTFDDAFRESTVRTSDARARSNRVWGQRNPLRPGKIRRFEAHRNGFRELGLTREEAISFSSVIEGTPSNEPASAPMNTAPATAAVAATPGTLKFWFGLYYTFWDQGQSEDYLCHLAGGSYGSIPTDKDLQCLDGAR